jgi:hypothetical protein
MPTCLAENVIPEYAPPMDGFRCALVQLPFGKDLRPTPSPDRPHRGRLSTTRRTLKLFFAVKRPATALARVSDAAASAIVLLAPVPTSRPSAAAKRNSLLVSGASEARASHPFIPILQTLSTAHARGRETIAGAMAVAAVDEAPAPRIRIALFP